MKLPTGYIDINTAIDYADVTRMTMIAWCKKYGIGKKIAGRWCVNTGQLDKLMSGEIGVNSDGKKKTSKTKSR